MLQLVVSSHKVPWAFWLGSRQAEEALAKVESFRITKDPLANFQVGKVDPVPAVSLDLGGFFSKSQRGQGPPSRPENILKFIHCSESYFCKRH